MIRLLIADDHQLMLDGIQSLVRDAPDIEVIGIAHNGREALDLVARHKPDVVLLDIDMPVMNGPEALELMRAAHPGARVVMLTMHYEKALIELCVKRGAAGYLLKNTTREELLMALHKVASGQTYFSGDVTMALLNQPVADQRTQAAATAGLDELTDREMEILKLIAEGLSNTQIGDKLFISPRTVDTHRTNLMRKLNVSNIAGLIRIAYKNKLI